MIDRRSNLSGDEFREQYLQTKTPVIVDDMMRDWPATYLWTKNYLTAVCGAQIVEVMSNRDADPLFEMRCDNHRTKMLFSEFANIAFSDHPSNNAYMVANNQFMNTEGGRRLMQDVITSSAYFDPARAPGQVFFWFGPGGTVTPLHHDVLDIFLTQVRGKKRVRLFSTDQSHLLYNSIGVYSDVDFEHPDFVKYPLYRHARPIEFDLLPGEMLFLPEGHWHQVRSLESSISVSFTNFRR
jgi:ribosomal protein L16 Arg81 hydroxylase